MRKSVVMTRVVLPVGRLSMPLHVKVIHVFEGSCHHHIWQNLKFSPLDISLHGTESDERII